MSNDDKDKINEVDSNPDFEVENLEKDESFERKYPDKERSYVFRNFRKELKRVVWPTEKKNYKFFLWTFLFIIILILIFVAVSFLATELVQLIGAQ